MYVALDTTTGNEEGAAQADISETEKSVAEVVSMLQDRSDRKLSLITASPQCQAC